LNEQPQSDNLDLRRWLRVLRRRWWIIAACTILVAGAAAAFSITRQKQYTATASLLFSQSQIGEELLGVPSSGSSDTVAALQADDVKLVQSYEVAVRTSVALRGVLTPQQVSEKITVSGIGASDFVAVAAQDSSPRFSALLANTYSRQFIKFRQQTERNQVIQVRDSFVNQLDAMSPAQRASSAGQSLQARIEQLNTLASAQTGDVQLVQTATVPTSPSFPNTKLNVAIGVVLGLLLGVGLMLLLERLNRRVRTVEELSEVVGYPVIAEVPETKRLRRHRELSAADGYEHNAFEMLRARLRYFPAERVQSLLVTSCAAQEGKTTVAWNLAEAMAMSAAGRVLLIEADLRRPTLAAVHGLLPEPGLAAVLSDQSDLGSALQHVELGPFGNELVPAAFTNGDGHAGLNGHEPGHSFDVLVAGPPPPNPSELIESDTMKQLLEGAVATYDTVLIDSGPALLVPEAIALVSDVSGVLVVSNVGGTTRDELVQLREQLNMLGAPVVGVVANRVKESGRRGYYYGYSQPSRSKLSRTKVS
jgi:Mrp family chromosome partitioning ATPase/capsular polysaccharide biosynthesis protein